MINFILLISRQGKTRLTKWFVQMNAKVAYPFLGLIIFITSLGITNLISTAV